MGLAALIAATLVTALIRHRLPLSPPMSPAGGSAAVGDTAPLAHASEFSSHLSGALAELEGLHSSHSERSAISLTAASSAAELAAVQQTLAVAAALEKAPLPAYTSLARQQLHHRLKAAISTKPGPPGSAAAATSARQAARQPHQHHPHEGAAAGQPWSAASAQLRVSPPLDPHGLSPLAGRGAEGLRPGSGGSQGRVGPGSPDAPAWPQLHRTSSGQPELDQAAGFVLPPPSIRGPRSRRKQQQQQQQQQQPVPPPPAGGAAGGTVMSGGGTATAPHWLAAELTHQQLYHALAPAGDHGSTIPGQHAQRSSPTRQPQQQPQQQAGVQRGLLVLLMPPLTGGFAGKWHPQLRGSSGCPAQAR